MNVSLPPQLAKGSDGPDTGSNTPDGSIASADGPAFQSDAPFIKTGKPCNEASQCQSGICADGICCATACSGTCQACNLTGTEGTCSFIQAGQDPRNECEQDPAATCARDGTCDGQGHCRRYPAGSVCLAGSCVGATEYAARTCDDKGVCQVATSRSCPSGSNCSGDSCGFACQSQADCQTGFFCEAGVCRQKRPLAASCTLASQCASEFCADGVCCASACGQPCFACNVAGSIGTCVAEQRGEDRHASCPAESASSCGRAGGCNGTGACLLYPKGTTCSQQTCVAAVEKPLASCDGLGTCGAGAGRNCGPYQCSGNTCGTTCASDADCTNGFVCKGGTCLPTLVIDDFEDAILEKSRIGGDVHWDNENCSLVMGQMMCTWNGAQYTWQDFLLSLRSPNWCEYDVSAYSKVRFKMRASTAAKMVRVYLGTGNGACTPRRPYTVLGDITVTTTMASYEVNLPTTNRDKAILVEFDPLAVDATQYFIDDVELVP